MLIVTLNMIGDVDHKCVWSGFSLSKNFPLHHVTVDSMNRLQSDRGIQIDIKYRVNMLENEIHIQTVARTVSVR